MFRLLFFLPTRLRNWFIGVAVWMGWRTYKLSENRKGFIDLVTNMILEPAFDGLKELLDEGETSMVASGNAFHKALIVGGHEVRPRFEATITLPPELIEDLRSEFRSILGGPIFRYLSDDLTESIRKEVFRIFEHRIRYLHERTIYRNIQEEPYVH